MEKTQWTRSFVALVLGGTTCMMCYSIGWHCGQSDSTSAYDRRLFEMSRMMREKDQESTPAEDAPQVRAAE